jgi:hypothetical protein
MQLWRSYQRALDGQAKGVNAVDRVLIGTGTRVDPAVQPDGIRPNIPSCSRVMLSLVVISDSLKRSPRGEKQILVAETN